MTSDGVAETREAILRGALEVFSHKGYVGATMTVIAKKANVNALTIFRHFQGKENLFREVLATYAGLSLDVPAMDSLVSGKTVLEGLTALADAYFGAMFKNIHVFRIFIIESTHFAWVKAMSWRMPPRLLAYLQGYLLENIQFSGTSEERQKRVALLAEMFLAHITRLTLQFNKHDSIWVYSEDLLNAFRMKMKPQILLFANFLMGDNAGGRISVRREKPVPPAAAGGESTE